MQLQNAELTAAALGDRREIEDVLTHEVQLLDDRRFEEWRDLFTDDGRYWVPLKPGQDSPDAECSLFYDDRVIMQTRFERLRHPNIHSQNPPHRTCHVIGNVVIEERRRCARRGDGEVEHDHDRLSRARAARVFRTRSAPSAPGRRVVQDCTQARRSDQLRRCLGADRSAVLTEQEWRPAFRHAAASILKKSEGPSDDE